MTDQKKTNSMIQSFIIDSQKRGFHEGFPRGSSSTEIPDASHLGDFYYLNLCERAGNRDFLRTSLKGDRQQQRPLMLRILVIFIFSTYASELKTGISFGHPWKGIVNNSDPWCFASRLFLFSQLMRVNWKQGFPSDIPEGGSSTTAIPDASHLGDFYFHRFCKQVCNAWK